MAPAVRPRSPFLSPEGTLRLPKTGKSQTNWRQKFSTMHASTARARHYTKPSGTSHGSPPGHAFGGLLGGRALTPRRPPRRPPGQGHMTVPILRLPWKQDEPPASPLAGGPKGWMLGHGPAPGGPRHIARPNPRTHGRIGPRSVRVEHLVGRPSKKESSPRVLKPH